MAVFVLYHIAGVIIGAAPSLDGVMRISLWNNPTVQDEFATWSRRLQAWGWGVDSEQLRDHAWRVGKSWSSARRAALSPFRGYQRLTGTHQSWRMFAAPHRHPTRWRIEIRYANAAPSRTVRPSGEMVDRPITESLKSADASETREAWTPLYIRGSDEFTWRRRQLDHVRMRSALFKYFWNRRTDAYRSLVHRLAVWAATDHPNAVEVRVRTYQFTTPTPDAVRSGHEPIGKFTRTDVVPLGPLR